MPINRELPITDLNFFLNLFLTRSEADQFPIAVDNGALLTCRCEGALAFRPTLAPRASAVSNLRLKQGVVSTEKHTRRLRLVATT